MTTEDDLRRAIETAFVHCRPGGAALFVPDWIRESFEPATKHGGHDSATRALRYLEWTYDPDPDDSTYITDFAYLLRDPNNTTRVEHDRHICGLFARAEWYKSLSQVGFQVKVLTDNYEREVFVGAKPA